MYEIKRKSGLFSLVGAAIALAFLPGFARAAVAPVPVSPGGPEDALIESPCPTFSWGGAPGADSYELVVYRIDETRREPEAILRQRLPASTYAWTPSLDRCLERGGRYAWSVRSVGGEGGDRWSSPSLFRVAAGPTQAELERALEIVRVYLAGLEATPEPASMPERVGGASEPERRRGGASAGDLASSGRIPGLGVEIWDDRIRIEGDDVVTTTTDSDTLGALSCLGGHVPKWNPLIEQWLCGTDGLGGVTCPSGKILRNVSGAWICDADRWTGYEVVQGTDITCGPLSFCTVSASCPTGKVVLSGGVSSGNLEGIRMILSHPSAFGNEWHTHVKNTTLTANRTFTPWAVCAGSSGGF